jgi:hypothetical protein
VRHSTPPAQFTFFTREVATGLLKTGCGELLLCLIALVMLSGLSLITLSASPIQPVLAAPKDLFAKATQQTLPLPSQMEIPACDPDWQVIQSPHMEATAVTLRDISAVSAIEIWSVGVVYSDDVPSTLTERWDGSSWSIIPSPNPGTSGSELYGVAALSSNDVWAVGAFYDVLASEAFALHWDGATWSSVQILNLPGPRSFLFDVDAISPNEVWAVGAYANGSFVGTLTAHWDGMVWTGVPTPNPSTTENILYGVTVASTNNVWVVGRYHPMDPPHQTLILHWDGNTWTQVLSPSPGAGNNELQDIDAVSSSDIWAVGSSTNGAGYNSLIMHWDGNTWVQMPSPRPGISNPLYGVTAISPNDVWATGYAVSSTLDTLIEHWDGSIWNVFPSASYAGERNHLYGVTAVSATDVWAVGDHSPDPATSEALMERYHPCTCPGDFTDVPAGSTFYPYVHCMACQGIINGYSSGCGTGNPCFRPGNNVTRGQLSKIVANAAGFTEPAGVQQYQDVPPDSSFYDFVWRLSDRGYIGGYECGGSGEPCVPPSNLPYFRPNGDASRGQISKIVSNAAGFTDPPGDQIFEDVPPSHTFYDFIQRLANRAIMGGYPCGGVGEPCIPPNNRPYFRPFNNATRGQTSKIVANTFFPDCQTSSGQWPTR